MLGTRNLPKVDEIVQVEVPSWSGPEGRVLGAWVTGIDIPNISLYLGEEGGQREIPSGALVIIRFFNREGFYALTGIVTGHGEEARSLVVTVKEVSRIQRRRNFRWPVEAPMRYAVREKDDAREWDEFLPEEWRPATTIDISAGGVRARLPEDVPRGAILLLEINLPSAAVRAEGRVVRVRPLSNVTRYGSEAGCIVGVEFTSITQAAEDEIVRFLYKEQMKAKSNVL